MVNLSQLTTKLNRLHIATQVTAKSHRNFKKATLSATVENDIRMARQTNDYDQKVSTFHEASFIHMTP